MRNLQNLMDKLKGGAGSGNWGHAGIPGKRGGSAPKSGMGAAMSLRTGPTANERQGETKGEKKDKYGRIIKRDKYGEYTLPTPESIKYAKDTLTNTDSKIWKVSDEKTKLENELSKLESKKGNYVVAAERRAGGLLGGGQDYASIAPKTRKKISEVKIEIENKNSEIEKLSKFRQSLFMDFAAELAK